MECGVDDLPRPCTVPGTIVAMPVFNEEERLYACLKALADQDGIKPGSLGVLLLLNNCTDNSAAIVAAFSRTQVTIRMVECTYAGASAGWARRMAMEEAAAWLRSSAHAGSVLITTDADSRVDRSWVARNLAAIGAGADAVAGCIKLDPAEASLLPAALHARGRQEAAYEALLTEICARLDPEPGNPWPCHWSKSGATIAVTLNAYEAVGGMPNQPTGEDRAFIDALVARDLLVRHDPNIFVVTSGRLDGRAVGGVANTIRLRCEIPDSPCDDRLETMLRVVMRCRLRRRLRNIWRASISRYTGRWAPALAIDATSASRIAEAPFFGEFYAERNAYPRRARPRRFRHVYAS